MSAAGRIPGGALVRKNFNPYDGWRYAASYFALCATEAE